MVTRRVSKESIASAEAEAPVVKQVVEEVLPQEETKEHEVVSELYKPNPADVPPEIIEESGSSIKPLLIWSLVVIGIALLTGGTLLVAMKGIQGVSLFAQPTPTPPPAGGPTPTPTPKQVVVKREEVTLQVLNGGGVAGSGAKMKGFLEEKGYTVTDVKNAEEFSFEETVIKVKPGKEAYVTLLQKDIEESYTVGSTSPDLPEDSPYDAQVIVGKK